MMKKVVVVALLGAGLFGSGPGWAASNPEDIAAVGLGVFTGLNFLNQAATHSRLDVKVEVYQSALDTQCDFFELSGPSSITPLMISGPVAEGSTEDWDRLRRTLAPVVDELQKAGEKYEELARMTASDISMTWNQISKDYQAMADLIVGVDIAWADFDNALYSAKADQKVDAAENQVLAAKAVRLQSAMTNVQKMKLSDDSLNMICSKVLPRGISDALEAASSKQTYAEQIAEILFRAKAIQHGDDYNAQFRTDADKALSEIGVPLNIDNLSEFTTPEAIAQRISSKIPEVKHQAELGNVAIGKAMFSSATSNVVLGPIKNEAIQVLLNENKAISRITDPSAQRYWKVLSTAHSSSGPGNHNTVVYLENMAMPTLKSAKYDPNAFIRANAELSRKLLHAFASSAGALSAAQAEYKPYNLLGIREEALKAESDKRETQTAMIRALRDVIKANGQDENDAKETIENAARVLQQSAN